MKMRQVTFERYLETVGHAMATTGNHQGTFLVLKYRL
jgi:hypothetical protein